MTIFYLKAMIIFTLLLLAISIQESYAASQLGEYGIVVYEETHGFPTSVAIEFVSDFVVNTEESANIDEMYFTYQLSGTGAPFYSDTSLTINNAGPGDGEIQIDLTKNSNEPTVGVYKVILAIDMMLKNPAGKIKMHENTYQLTIYLQGTEASMKVDTTGQVAPQPETSDNSETNIETSESALPVDLALISEGSVGFGDDIVLHIDEVGSDSPNYKIWLDTNQIVEVYSDFELTNKVYDWPSQLVDAIDNEEDAGMSLTVTLQTVPQDLYDLGRVYVKLSVKFRDLAGDIIRQLNVVDTDIPSSTGEDEDDELSANFISAVTFDSYRHNLGAGKANDDGSSMFVTALVVGGASGVALWLACVALYFYCKNRSAASRRMNNNNDVDVKGVIEITESEASTSSSIDEDDHGVEV